VSFEVEFPASTWEYICYSLCSYRFFQHSRILFY